VSKPFPDLSLYTIAIDGTWDEPLWDDQAKPRYTQCIAANLYRNTVPFETTAGSEYRGNFLAAKSLFATIPELPFQFAALDRQTSTPFRTASPNNGPTAAGLHANKKSMRALALDDGRLIGTLHFWARKICRDGT